MGRAELLLLATAILIFEVFTTTLTKMQLDIRLNNITSRLDNFAISVSKSYLEKIEVYAFDEKINSNNELPNGFNMPDSLSHPDSLGRDIGDVTNDDIDDFIITGLPGSIIINDSTYFNYTLDCDIYYISNDLSTSLVRTPKKRADVTIHNNFLNHSIKFSRIFSYY